MVLWRHLCMNRESLCIQGVALSCCFSPPPLWGPLPLPLPNHVTQHPSTDTFQLNYSRYLQHENRELLKENKRPYSCRISFSSTDVFPHFTEIHHIPPSERPANLKAVFLSQARNALGYALQSITKTTRADRSLTPGSWASASPKDYKSLCSFFLRSFTLPCVYT